MFFLGGSAIALSVICLPFVAPAFRRVCLPYVPATTAQVENVMRAITKNPDSKNIKNLIEIADKYIEANESNLLKICDLIR